MRGAGRRRRFQKASAASTKAEAGQEAGSSHGAAHHVPRCRPPAGHEKTLLASRERASKNRAQRPGATGRAGGGAQAHPWQTGWQAQARGQRAFFSLPGSALPAACDAPPPQLLAIPWKQRAGGGEGCSAGQGAQVFVVSDMRHPSPPPQGFQSHLARGGGPGKQPPLLPCTRHAPASGSPNPPPQAWAQALPEWWASSCPSQARAPGRISSRPLSPWYGNVFLGHPGAPAPLGWPGHPARWTMPGAHRLRGPPTLLQQPLTSQDHPKLVAFTAGLKFERKKKKPTTDTSWLSGFTLRGN